MDTSQMSSSGSDKLHELNENLEENKSSGVNTLAVSITNNSHVSDVNSYLQSKKNIQTSSLGNAYEKMHDNSQQDNSQQQPNVKRGRGRPRKYPVEIRPSRPKLPPLYDEEGNIVKRKRGRPRKNPDDPIHEYRKDPNRIKRPRGRPRKIDTRDGLIETAVHNVTAAQLLVDGAQLLRQQQQHPTQPFFNSSDQPRHSSNTFELGSSELKNENQSVLTQQIQQSTTTANSSPTSISNKTSQNEAQSSGSTSSELNGMMMSGLMGMNMSGVDMSNMISGMRMNSYTPQQ